jgi:putative transposase
MKMEVSVAEVKDLINAIQQGAEGLFEMIRVNVQEGVGAYLSKLMDVELSHFLGRERYKRSEGEVNHRNGSYGRHFTLKGIGDVGLRVPRDRKGEYRTEIIPRSKQYEDALRQDLCAMFLAGVSTRTLSAMSQRLIGRKISPTEVSKASKELTGAVEQWRGRDLSGDPIKYLFVDGVIFSMRLEGSIEKVPVLVVIGVIENGQRRVLALQAGDKESAPTWRELFKDLKRRGLDATKVTLGVMDGLPGLEKVFEEEFPKGKVQRCQIHVARNVLAKVPRKLKEAVADDLRSVFYASSKSKALEFSAQFKERWQNQIPSAVQCVRNSIDACLTFMAFPEEEWISLRTTNIIERLNKEFRRRTKSMEIVAGETSCYTLLAFICLKMEMHWRSNPIGKVADNLPFFKMLGEKTFTQKS